MCFSISLPIQGNPTNNKNQCSKFNKVSKLSSYNSSRWTNQSTNLSSRDSLKHLISTVLYPTSNRSNKLPTITSSWTLRQYKDILTICPQCPKSSTMHLLHVKRTMLLQEGSRSMHLIPRQSLIKIWCKLYHSIQMSINKEETNEN